jgi:hypothetical protein
MGCSMGQTSEVLLLRPLSIGEIFDRAITLYVATLTRSLQILGLYFGAIILFAAMIGGLYFVSRSSLPGVVAIIVGLPAIIAGSIWLYSAIIYIWAEQAAGRRVSWSEALLAVRPRFWPLLGLTGLIVLTVALLFFGVALVSGIVWVISGLAGAGTARAIILVLFAVPGGIALFVVSVLTYLVLSVALVTCVVEGVGPMRAFGSAYARVVEGGMGRRSIVVGIAFLAAVLGVAIVSLGVRLACTALLVPIAGTFGAMGIGAVIGAVIGVIGGLYYRGLTVVYYFDLRIRTEGYDIARAVEQLVT